MHDTSVRIAPDERSITVLSQSGDNGGDAASGCGLGGGTGAANFLYLIFDATRLI